MATGGSDPQQNDWQERFIWNVYKLSKDTIRPWGTSPSAYGRDTQNGPCEYNRNVLLNSTTDNLLEKNKRHHETQQLEETFACYSSYSLRFTNCAVSQTDDLDFLVCIILLLVHFRDAISVTSHFSLSVYLSSALPRLIVSANVSQAKWINTWGEKNDLSLHGS